MSSSMIELVLLAAIAGFVGWRLYSTLGSDSGAPDGRTRTTNPEKPAAKPGPKPVDNGDTTIDFIGPAAAGLSEIHKADRSFVPREFLIGAKSAYEMIVTSFAKGDRAALRPWLDDDVYEAWDKVIAEREVSGVEAPQLLRIKKADIEDASLRDHMARVTVRFESELGDGERMLVAKELWTFMRDVRAEDPNWLLDDVDAAH